MQVHRFAGLLLIAVVVWSLPLAGQQPLKVTIDVKPGDEKVTIEPEREGMVPIVIVTTPQFDAAKVDPDTIRVGPAGTEASIFRSMLEDVDKDGDVDRMVLVRVRDMQIKCGNKSIRVTGRTEEGRPFEGSDAVTTEGC
jgi:hypothetical protein